MCFRNMFAVAAVVLCMACSILEDRKDCPCFLHMDFTSVSCQQFDTLVAVICSAKGDVMRPVRVARDQFETGVVVPLTDHDGVWAVVYPSELSDYFQNGKFMLEHYEDCPNLYSFNCFCDTAGDECVCHVMMFKNSCNVTLRFLADASDYLLEVSSLFSGLGENGIPVRGEFMRHLELDKNLTTHFTLPRQGDESLKLVVKDRNGRERSFALGQIMKRSGYDWTAINLEDITVTVDYAGSQVILQCRLWEDEIFIPLVV